MNRVAAAALMFLLGIGTISGQSDQTESVLDRVVPEQPNGGPFAPTSLVPNWSDRAALSVARAARIVIGFEAAPDAKEVGAVATQEIAAQLEARAERGQLVSLAGKTVREALDTIVAIDPRYRWIDVHGVPVVRPWASWTDPRHPLNQVVAPIVWPEIDLATALSKVSALVSGTETSGPVPGSGRGPVFALRTGPIAVMELLNAIGVAHGGPVSWHMRHRCTIADPRAIYIHLQAYDGDQLWGLGSCRAPSRESSS